MFIQEQSQLHTIRDLLRFAVSQFSKADLHFGHGSANAYDEAAYLILKSLYLPLDQLEVFLDAGLTNSECKQLLELIEKRIKYRIPAAYLTNEAWLGDFSFYVDQRVIIPRSFIAELLREQLAPWIPEPHQINTALDLCTGSGCLAILLAHAFENSVIDAIDISACALEVAHKNVHDYGLEERIFLSESNLFSALQGKRYDVIISNPPYVNAESMARLPMEYSHEPQNALASGIDGLDIVRLILQQAARYLTNEGILVVEIGHNRIVLEQEFPELPFVWLETSGGESFIFLLHRHQLPSSSF